MQPKAGSDRFDVRREGENVVLVERKGGREIVLDPIAGAVWLRADGAHDVRELAAVVGRDLDALIGEPEVWAALDALGDAGLLESRVAPPADTGVSRRFLLRTAAVAGTLFVGTAGVAAAADKGGDERADTSELGRWRAAAEQAQKGEQSAKSQESDAKRSLSGAQGREQSAKASEDAAKLSVEQSHKGEATTKARENEAKVSAESAEKTALEDLRSLKVAQEEGAKVQRQQAALEAQLSQARADEQSAKVTIAREQETKAVAEQKQKVAAEQLEKQAAAADEQKAKISAEQAEKQSAQAAEQRQKQAAEQAAKSTAPGVSIPGIAVPPPA